MHPDDNEYDIVATPDDIPLMTPVEDPTVATEVLPELHMPLPVASDNVVVWPAHTPVLPVIPADAALTVTTEVTTQPVPSE